MNLYDTGERKTLEQIKAVAQHCTPEMLQVKLTPKPEHEKDPQMQAVLDAAASKMKSYLSGFLPPGDCVCCGSTLGGNDKNLMAAAFGSFEWGLVYGEGRCMRCGYPARAIHRIDLGEGGEFSFPWILQYHPDQLERFTPQPPRE